MPVGQLIFPQLLNNFPPSVEPEILLSCGVRPPLDLTLNQLISDYKFTTYLKYILILSSPFCISLLRVILEFPKKLPAKVASNLQGNYIRITVTDLTREHLSGLEFLTCCVMFSGKISAASKICGVREKGNKYDIRTASI